MLVNIDPQDVIDDLSDDDLVKAVVDRKLQVKVQIATDAKRPVAMRGSVLDHARDALEHMLGRRNQRALDAMRRAIEAYVPPELLAAYEHAQSQRWSAAVCELDRYVVPSTTPTAKYVRKQAGRSSEATA